MKKPRKMEISSSNSKINLEKGQNLQIGRGQNLNSTDPTLSRKQISLSLPQNHKPSIQFEVIGKNPIWVYDKNSDEIRVFKKWVKGELVDGDGFCLSGKNPVWFRVREIEEMEIGGVLDLDLEIESIDFSGFNPVKEFGFLVIGHEFDNYPKHKIRPPKTWDWFLDESKKDSDDDEEDEISGRKRSKSTRRKRKKGDGDNDDDDEWTGESEEDKELISKSRKVQRPNYSTRSKDHTKPAKKKGESRSSTQKKVVNRDEEDEEEGEEEDETLGGFIVTDDEVKQEEEDDDETELDEEEEEEDFDEEDDED